MYLQFTICTKAFFKEKDISRRTASTNKSLFSTSEAGEEEGKEEEEERDEKVVKSHIQSIEDEISKLCQGMLLILYYCALYIMERFS